MIRFLMYGSTAASASWMYLWYVTGLDVAGLVSVGFAVLAFLWWMNTVD